MEDGRWSGKQWRRGTPPAEFGLTAKDAKYANEKGQELEGDGDYNHRGMKMN